jgi:AraC family transcriptional regulator
VTQTYLPCGCPCAANGFRAAGVFNFRLGHYLPCCTLGAHVHDEPRVVLPLAGYFETRHGKRAIALHAGTAMFRPAYDEHSDASPVAFECLSICLPQDGARYSPSKPYMIGNRQIHGAAWAARQELALPDAASSLVLEGLAELLVSVVLHRRIEEAGVPRWIHIVREQLEAEYLASPSLEQLGQTVGRDPAYVSATFQRVYGQSPGQYLRHLRLWQARHALDTNPESSLSDVAADAGFADQSHFTRHFKRLFRVTPAVYRQRHGVAQEPSPQDE